jgi:flagellar basal-body rod protein FlgG
MNGAFEISGVGLVTQQQALDAIAGNIANVNTPGFKRAEVRFSEILARQLDPSNPRSDLAGAPATASVSARVSIALDEQGDLEPTGHMLDLAIEGRGFVELLGPRGEILLWRGGRLSIQADGTLATADGLALRAMISAPENATSIALGADGVAIAIIEGQDGPIDLGRIGLVGVASANDVERLDGGLYRLREDARVEQLDANENGAGTFVQGAIERSNVDLNDEMVRLMIVQRAYAANAQIVQAADQLMAIVNGLRR